MRKLTVRSHFRAVTFAVLALAMAMGCTKKKEEKNEVDPDAYIAKSVFFNGGGTQAKLTSKSSSNAKLFHLSRGVEEADSDNDIDLTPGKSEDFGLVQARITEKELQFVLMFDPHGRVETAKIVASYPITKHFDIESDTNDFGEKTHKIVEKTDKPWDQRAYMRIDWQSPSNTLSNFAGRHATENWINEKYMDKEENTVLLETPTVTKDGYINFLVETSIKTAQKRIFTFPYSIETTAAYRVVYRTHLMPVKNDGFESVPYTLKDFQKFGYFYTQQNFEDPEKGLQEKDIRIYANVHNVCEKGHGGPCATNKITWVLSKDFPEFYKEEARKAIHVWNETFKAALNREDDVVVLDESVEATLSDPRYNTIAYYPERTNAGLLGVAQWVSDPRTGQLVTVRANVYQDGINGTLGSIDTIIDLLNSNDPYAEVIKTNALGVGEKYASPYDGGTAKTYDRQQALAQNIKTPRFERGTSFSLAEAKKAAFERMGGGPEKANSRLANYISKVPDLLALEHKESLFDEEMQPRPFPTRTGNVQIPNLGGTERLIFAGAQIKVDKMKSLRDAASGIHGAELVEDAAIRFLLKIIKKEKLEKIDAGQRKAIKDSVAKETFYSTLLHEMGHTFGLRHNFRGSSDPANFHPQYKAIKAALAKGDKSVSKEDLEGYAMSSIMDYGRDFWSDEGGLGPYDNAAIKYAYNRSLDREKDPIVKQGFAFCTDHEVDESILCRRFDKGSNVSEITQATINGYNNYYPLMHYRRGRVAQGNQSGWGNPYGLIQNLLTRTMFPVRAVMDEFLYAFYFGEEVPLSQKLGNYCDKKFIRASVEAGEIAPICDAAQMEAAGVNPNDLETLFNALYDGSGKLRVKDQNPSNYIPYGVGDLLWSNRIARNFFLQVIGSTEPGRYLALPADGTTPETEKASLHSLLKLPAGTTDEEALIGFFIEREIPAGQHANLVKAYLPKVVEVKVGPNARQLETVTARTGGYYTNEILGSWWDKYAALIALSERDLGVQKYNLASMAPNVYFTPQNKKFGTFLFGSIISKKNSGNNVMNIPVQMKDKSVVLAKADAAFNVDIYSLAGIMAVGNLTTSTDMSMLNKLRVCVNGEGGCEPGPEKLPVAEFTANGKTYRAVQTYEADSIAYKIVSEAAALQKTRTDSKKGEVPADEAFAKALMAFDAAKPVVTELDKTLAKHPELAEVRNLLTAPRVEGQPMSLWVYTELIKAQAAKLGYFAISKDAEGILASLDGANGMMAEAVAAAEKAKNVEGAQTLKKIAADVKVATDAIAGFYNTIMAVRMAPHVQKNMTSALERAESQVIFLRRLLKQEE